jgi:hypothetical protein
MPRIHHLELRELFDMGLDDAREGAQGVGATDGSHRGPPSLGGDRPGDRRVDIADGRAGDLADRLGGRRVDHGEGAHDIAPEFIRDSA